MTQITQESVRNSINGFFPLIVGLALHIGSVAMLIRADEPSPQTFLLLVPMIVVGLLLYVGLYMLQPNQAAVLTLFGSYRGSDRTQGLRWANPFYAKARISLRARNFVSEKIKVNDKGGNPIEIAAAIVWNVEDTALAVFNVENYELFVRVQSEAAVRHMASLYAYDNMDEAHAERLTLRGGGEAITRALKMELTSRLKQAGIEVIDATLTHLAYAPEIAGAMLRRQQAEAVLAARRKIVQGAVDMVEMALHSLSERELIVLDDERRASMVSNLLVVLVGEKEVAPVINSGTLYS
ncbi:MAG: SPFH domain-containing protein [Burkholderiales bacterium]|nr:SPFH domain-containing protein [Burkholderiales bacterium]